MYKIPLARRPLPMLGPLGEQRCPWLSDMKSGVVPQDERPTTGATGPSGVRAIRRRAQLAAAPWESLAVQQLVSKMRPQEGEELSMERPVAMSLQGPSGTVMQAVGQPEDHRAAGEAVRVIHERQQASTAEARKEQRQAEARGRMCASSVPMAHSTEKGKQIMMTCGASVAFGAVYEHRDAVGKAKLVSSTNLLPERQFQLDWQEQPKVKELVSAGGAPGSTGHLVWVGVGTGPIGEKEMTEVREAVVSARAERLHLQKLGSEKPYSRHF